MSDVPMTMPPESGAPRRIELIFYCAELRREYAETLRLLGRFVHDQKTWFGAFHTLQNGNPPGPIWDSASLDTFFFVPPLVFDDRDLATELILDGDGVEYLWVVPITRAEANFKMSHGAGALLDLLDANKHSHIFSGDRRSYV